MGKYDISGVKNDKLAKSKSSGISADSSYWDNLKKTDKSSRSRIISEGKDEVENFDFSYDFGKDEYDTLSSKGEAYLSYKADSDVNAAGAKEVSLATSADNAKDGNFVNSVITDEDVWEGTIKFEKYEDGVYKVVKVDKDGNRVVMGYADEASKQNFYRGAAQEVKNSAKDGSGVDKSGNNSSKSTNTNISDGDSDSNEVSKDNKSTKKKGIDDTEVSGNGTTTSGGNNNNNSNLSGSDNSSNNSSVAAQKSAKELSAEIAAAREGLSKDAKISDKITVSEKKLGTLLEKMQTENLSTDDLKEVKKYYKDIYKSYKNTLKQREDDLKNGDLSKEEKKVCKNDIKILEEACSFFKSKYYTVEYDNDMKNQEAVNYNSNIEIDNDALEKSMEKVSLPSGVHYQYDYKKYCELVGKDKAVSPLDFYKAVKKKEGECSNIPETYLGDTGNTDLLKRISDTDKSLSTISKANGNDSSISVYSNLYNYYYYTQGAEAAEKYAIKMKEQFNSINGTAEALEKNNMLTDDLNSGKGGKLAAQIHALFYKMTYGAGNVGTGAVNAIKAIAGGKDQEVQTQKDFEKETFSQLLNERGSDFTFINKYGETLGEMATYSVLAALTGPLTAAGGGAAAAGEAATTASGGGAIASVTNFASKGINSKLAMSSFQGLTTFGNLYHSTRVEGNDHESSLNYAAISGISSTALEYLIGGIEIFGKNAGEATLKASGFATEAANSGIKNALVKVGSSVGFNLGKETLQEGLQEGAETALDTLVLRKKFLDEESSWEDVKANIKEAIISGGIISLIMNTSRATSNLALGAVETHDTRSSRVRSDTNVESSSSREKIREIKSNYDEKSSDYERKKSDFDAYEKKLDEEEVSYTDRYLDKTYNEKLDELQQAENELELSKKKLEDVEMEEQNNIQKKDNSDADLDNNTEKHKHDGEGIGISLNGKHDKKRLSGVVNTLKSKLGSLKGIETLKKIKSTFDVSNTKEKIKELQRDYENKKARFEERENELEEKGMGYSDRYVDEEYIKRFDELQLAKKELELSKKKLEDLELEEQNNIQKKDNSDADLDNNTEKHKHDGEGIGISLNGKHDKKRLSGVVNTLKSKLGSLKGIETLKKIKSTFDVSNTKEKIKELQRDYENKKARFEERENELEEKGMGYSDRYVDEEYIKRFDELQLAKKELELSKKKLEDLELEEQNNIQKKGNSDADLDSNTRKHKHDGEGMGISLTGEHDKKKLSGVVNTLKSKLGSLKGIETLKKIKSTFDVSNTKEKIKELQRDYENKKARFEERENELEEKGMGYSDRYVDEEYIKRFDELQLAKKELELSKKKLEDLELEEQNNIQKKGNSDADLDSNTRKHKHDGEGMGISLTGEHDKKKLSGVVNTLKSKLGSLKGIETLKKIKSTFDVSNTKEKIKELQRDYENKKARFEERENELEEKGMGYSDRYVDEEYIKRFDELQLAKKELELSKKKLEDLELEEQNNIQKKGNSDAKQSESVSSLRSLQRISYEEIKDMNSNQIRKKFLKDVPILSDSTLVKKFANIFAKKGRIDYKDLVYTENKKPPTKEAIAAYDDYFSSPEIRQKLVQQDQGKYLRHYYTKEYPGFDKGINNRFYLNLEGNDVLKFNKLFVEECLSENLPFYFKSGVYSKKYFDTHKEICSSKLLKRSDSVIIYCMKEDCGDMFRIIKKIQNENPDISFLEPPLATGKVDVGIGYGFERKYTSYNDRKAVEISGVLERVSKAFKEKYGNSNLETINEHFDDYLKMVNKKANELNCNSYLSEDDKELLSLSAVGDKSSVVGDKSNAVADIIANKLVMQKIKLNNGKRFSSPSELLDYVCRSMGDVGAERLYELYEKATKKGKLDYDDLMFITDKNDSREAVKLLYNSSPTLNHFCNYIGTFLENYSGNTSNKKFIETGKYDIGEAERFFENYRSSDGSFGVDQGIIYNLCSYEGPDGKMYHYREVKEICNKARENGRTLPIFKKYGNDEYFSLKNKLKKLGFNDRDASIVLSSIDDFGACSYAAICNTIFNKFRNRPDLFEETFGYSMYRKDNGKLKLNSSELLLDLYLFANDKRNGGKFFYTNANGGKNIDSIYKANVIDSVGRSILNGKEQFFFISDNFNNDEMINNFLKSKSSKLEYYGNYIFRNAFCSNRKPLNDIELHYVIQTIKNEIKRGKALGLYVAHDENFPVTFRAMDKNVSDVSTANWNEGGAHDVGIIGINKDGLIVSSWGNKYLISFSDLANGRINIHSCDIKLV